MYKCNICHSTYSHPGNFKQHLLKHEREKRGMSGDSNHLNSVLQSAFGETQFITFNMEMIPNTLSSPS